MYNIISVSLNGLRNLLLKLITVQLIFMDFHFLQVIVFVLESRNET
jgi:hypothetical protein